MNVDAFYLPINRMMAEDCTLDDRIQADDCDIELGESVVAIELELARACVCGLRTGETLSKMWSVSFPTCVVYCVRISQSISATKFDTERARERVARALVRTEKSREGSRFSTYSCVAHTRANATSRDRTIDRTR